MSESDSHPLTRKQKRQLDRMMVNLLEYFNTDEGKEMLEKTEGLFSRISLQPVELPAPELTDQEQHALKFIRKELGKGHSPSVRKVTRAIGLRSSRSGQRIITTLIGKSILTHIDKKRLVLL
jgi:hypothetical protein